MGKREREREDNHHAITHYTIYETKVIIIETTWSSWCRWCFSNYCWSQPTRRRTTFFYIFNSCLKSFFISFLLITHSSIQHSFLISLWKTWSFLFIIFPVVNPHDMIMMMAQNLVYHQNHHKWLITIHKLRFRLLLNMEHREEDREDQKVIEWSIHFKHYLSSYFLTSKSFMMTFINFALLSTPATWE